MQDVKINTTTEGERMRIIIKEAGTEYPMKDAPAIKTPQDAADQAEELRASETEAFCVMLLDAQNKLKLAEIVTTGIADATLVHPREVFRSAVKAGACAIIILHNHPSGDPTPSAEDIRMTKTLVDAGKVLDIKVLDHVIVGETTLSLREEGLVDFV